MRYYSTEGPLKRTALFDLHNQLGGKMVPFAGWEMPVQYPEGVLKEHNHCRTVSSLFDVSRIPKKKQEKERKEKKKEIWKKRALRVVGEKNRRLFERAQPRRLFSLSSDFTRVK